MFAGKKVVVFSSLIYFHILDGHLVCPLGQGSCFPLLQKGRSGTQLFMFIYIYCDMWTKIRLTLVDDLRTSCFHQQEIYGPENRLFMQEGLQAKTADTPTCLPTRINRHNDDTNMDGQHHTIIQIEHTKLQPSSTPASAQLSGSN